MSAEIIVENFSNTGDRHPSPDRPIKDKSEKIHTKTHINLTKNKFKQKKATNNTQGNPHKVISRFFSRNSESQIGVARCI